jgi:hypothetical protein
MVSGVQAVASSGTTEGDNGAAKCRGLDRMGGVIVSRSVYALNRWDQRRQEADTCQISGSCISTNAAQPS